MQETIIINQNTETQITIEAEGNWVDNVVYFTLKKEAYHKTRLISIPVTDINFSAEENKSIFTFKLLPEHNQELSGKYYWDLKTENSAVDRKLIKKGYMLVEFTVRRDSDVLPPELKGGVVVLSANEFEVGDMFCVKEIGGVRQFAVMSKEEVKELYGFNDLPLLVQTADLLGGEIDLFNLDGVGTTNIIGV